MAFKKTFANREISLDRIPTYLIMGQGNAYLVCASIGQFLLAFQIFCVGTGRRRG
jgi:hypothetical protein